MDPLYGRQASKTQEETELLEEDIPDSVRSHRLQTNAKHQVKHNYEMDSSDEENEAENGDDAASNEIPKLMDMGEFEGLDEVEAGAASDTEENKADVDMEYYNNPEEFHGHQKPRMEPKMDAFNLREEQESGTFDIDGNYIKKTKEELEEDKEHQDAWLNDVGASEIKRAREAHELREEQEKARRREKAALQQETPIESSLFPLIEVLQPAETSMEALQRLNAKLMQIKKQFKRRKGARIQQMEETYPELKSTREHIESITSLCDVIAEKGINDIYEQEREELMRLYKKHSGKDFSVARGQQANKRTADDAGLDVQSEAVDSGTVEANKKWVFRWVGDSEIHGPYSNYEMNYWKQTYFDNGVEVRNIQEESPFVHVQSVMEFT
ncbi:hypothetical protein BABINDRAFT_7836 [Babjeviella inositovora NRRL Y-12698]|uniref:GYF domain-containing protein n=1 Tax=Babjeviella inositovora NRRL Y-12698 TaxID=984486 RepID=A0A1E3QTR2_9ASCO|nr:uncharacterized protein BABINDRAFT_7836 [Babjeviella inositovora NRRL Y-12698]ODQ80402.1 hypothetical protein BABINDRAFT_7836 [Babjeviella inositovora NRRL Y-12698]